MGSKWTSPWAISCQMWPHPWWSRAPWGLGWMWLKQTSPYLGRISTISWAGKGKAGEALWGHLAPHSPLQPSDSCGLHFGAQVGHGLEQSLGRGWTWWAEKLAGFQRCPWLLLSTSEMSWFCSTWRGREEGWGRNGISRSGVCNDLHRTISGGSSSHSVAAFTHIVGCRASPRQEGGESLPSDECLNIIPLEQAEQEEMKGSQG